MDRKHQLKHKGPTGKSLREKRRRERHDSIKSKREEILKRKRMRKNSKSEDFPSAEEEITEEQIVEWAEKLVKAEGDKCESLKLLRNAFSMGSALIDAFLGVEGALQCLVSTLEGGGVDEQVEAAWCLSNIAAGTDSQAVAVIDAAGNTLIKMLSSEHESLKDHCAWAIGNLAGGNELCRNELRVRGAVEPLIKLLQSPKLRVVHCAAFALSNLARDKETTIVLTEAGILPQLASHLVYAADKQDILTEVAWMVTYLTACGTHEKEVLSAGILDKVIEVIVDVADKDEENVQVLTPLLRCLGNIICSGLDDTSPIASEKKELFAVLDKLLVSEHQAIRKECIWVLSNITAIVTACHEVVGGSLLSSICNLLSSTFDLKKEAAYTLCNIAAHGDDFCVKLLETGVMKAAIPLLQSSDVETVHYALSFCEMIMHGTKEVGVKAFEDGGGLVGMETLEYNENDQLRAQADNILDVYFYKEDHVEDVGAGGDNGSVDQSA